MDFRIAAGESALKEYGGRVLRCSVEFFHPSRRIVQFRKPELAVQSMRIARDEAPAAQSLQFGMRHDRFHQPFAEGMTSIIFMDEDITDVGKDREIGNDAREAHLSFAIVHSKIQ